MIRITSFGPVKRFDLAHNLAGAGLYWTTAYLVGDVMVDSGCAHTASELAGALRDTPLKTLVNTHSHEDHIGANAALMREHSGLEIRAHPLALDKIADPRQNQPLHPYRRLFWGYPEASQARPLHDGELITSGDYHLQVMFTPGHSPDHLCLYEAEQGWLFSGDLFVGGKDRALRQGCKIWQLIASLKKLADLQLTMLFSGSARVRREPGKEIIAKIEYYEAMAARVDELAQRGCSEKQIARRVFGRAMWVELVTMGHFSRLHLVKSYLTPTP
jgi:glyoxylase-like metal-dependent hydrolase (beta-lactamase superfamily II)